MHIRGAARAGVVAFAVAGGLALAGCTGDDPAPKPTTASPQPTSSTSEPTTSEPTIAPPQLPTSASANDAAGGESFLRYWFDAANYSLQTGDVEPVAAISADDCVVCNAMIDQVEDAYGSGGKITGQQFKVESVAVPAIDESGVTLADVRYSQSAGEVLSSDGTIKPLLEVPAESAGFVIAFRDGSWSLEGVGTL